MILLPGLACSTNDRSQAAPAAALAGTPGALSRATAGESGLAATPGFFTGVNIYDLAADPAHGYECNSPEGIDPDIYLDKVFATLVSANIDMVRFWAFQSYAKARDTGARYWGAFDRVMAKAHQFGIYLIPVLDNQWNDCNIRQPNPNTSGETGYPLRAEAWASEFSRRYADENAIYAFEVKNEARASSKASPSVQALRDDLKRRVDVVKAATGKPVSLGNAGEGEAGFEDSALVAIYAYTGATLVTSHDYKGWSAKSTSCGLASNECAGLNAAFELGLSYYIGEAGSKGCDGLAKADELRKQISAARAAGAAGFIYWDFTLQTPPGNCGYEIGPGGEVIKVFREF